MMIRKPTFYRFILITLMLFPAVSTAAQLYRYIDINGTPTLSKTLPADAAQRGYDILDDRTMRLIERVPAALTEAELKREAERLSAEQALRDQAAEEAKSQAEIRQQQRIYDRNLLAIYRSEKELVSAREAELTQWQSRITVLEEQRPVLEHRMRTIQQQAAERELSGERMSVNLQKRLQAAEEELINNRNLSAEMEAEYIRLIQQYKMDHERLLQLLEARSN